MPVKLNRYLLAAVPITMKYGEEKDFQRIVILIYEKLASGSNVNENRRRLGCCPKAGNYFRIKNPVYVRINNMGKSIDDFIAKNPGLPAPAVTGLQNIAEELKGIFESLKPARRRRRIKQSGFRI